MHAALNTATRTFTCPTCAHPIEHYSEHWLLTGGVVVCPRCALADIDHIVSSYLDADDTADTVRDYARHLVATS